MSFFNINSENLTDSKSFTKAIVDNIVPKNGIAITKTSLSERRIRRTNIKLNRHSFGSFGQRTFW